MSSGGSRKKPLLVLTGPTAIGKTDISLELAKKIRGEIISADSMLVYREMNIGTAKPDQYQLSMVPHHMINIVNPDQIFNAAIYSRKAEEIIKEIDSRDRLPVLSGGTGLYINAVINGYSFTEAVADSKLRMELLQDSIVYGKEHLFDKLVKIDPVSAEKIHKNNVKRVIRALEVYYLTGKKLSAAAADNKPDSPYDLIFFGLTADRKTLYNRIEKRVDKMIASGLVEEVEGLLNRGYNPGLNSMQGLGYKEMVHYLNGELSLEEAIDLLKMNTRHFAKRQLTWFNRDSRIIWLDINQKSDKEILDEIAVVLEGVF